MSYFLCLVDELSGDDDSFLLHVWTLCRVNRVLVSACCSIDTQPGDKAWDMEDLSTGHSTFISHHQMKTVLLLWVWWSAAAAWCFREAEWYQRHRHMELFRSEELQVRSARFVPWGLPHTDLADEPCGTLTSCSLLYQVFLSPGSTKVLTSPTESQLVFFLLLIYFFLFNVPLHSCVSKRTPQLAHGQPAWVQRHSSAALVQGDTDWKTYAVSQGPMY